jgi:hypothetical protein
MAMLTSDDAATLQALIEGVDHAAREAEAEWGIERLPVLVGDELRCRFRRQQTKWCEALQAAWSADVLTRAMLDDVTLHAGAMQRAWGALAAAAAQAGHRPIAPWVWEVRLKDGTVAAVVQTNAEASKVIADGRHVAVYTLDEVANVIDSLGLITLAKMEFPGTKVMPAGHYAWTKEGDEVPFG